MNLSVRKMTDAQLSDEVTDGYVREMTKVMQRYEANKTVWNMHMMKSTFKRAMLMGSMMAAVGDVNNKVMLLSLRKLKRLIDEGVPSGTRWWKLW